MAVQLGIMLAAGRHNDRDPDSVQEKSIGVRLTDTAVVFFDPETEDQWLRVSLKDLHTISDLARVGGRGYIPT